MAFSPEVKERALAASGRHCCICHRFVALKIECHHIVEENAGGDNSFENCIPLCFDCHADMRGYDVKHPRGTKYRPNELRAHRDAWYEKVASSGGTAAAPAHSRADRATFLMLQQMLPWDNIRWIKEQNFGDSFFSARLQLLHMFLDYGENPAHEFLDSELEGARATLIESLQELMEAIGVWTFPLDGNKGYHGVPKDWLDRNPDRWQEAVGTINKAAAVFFEAYTYMIRLGRERLESQ